MHLSATALKVIHHLGGGDGVSPGDLTTVAAILLTLASDDADPLTIGKELLAYLEEQTSQQSDRELQRLWGTGWHMED